MKLALISQLREPHNTHKSSWPAAWLQELLCVLQWPLPALLRFAVGGCQAGMLSAALLGLWGCKLVDCIINVKLLQEKLHQGSAYRSDHC
jgi:hypothetical protein